MRIAKGIAKARMMLSGLMRGDLLEGGIAGVLLRVLVFAVSGFREHGMLLRAAALSYTTVLSLAPLLAVAFSISKGLGLQNTAFVRQFLLRVTAGRAEFTESILRYIDTTGVATLGAVGTVLLFVTTLSLIGSIEAAFNQVWGVRRPRTLLRKFTDYFSVILVVPPLALLAASFTLTLSSASIVQGVLRTPVVGDALIRLLSLAPYVITWVCFTFAYSFIPNTRVRLAGAAIGGVVAGTAWQLAQWAYVSWQVGVRGYNAIYGSLAQFPLLLVWLYISWLIVLFGAELSHAMQNLGALVSRVRAGDATPKDNVLAGLRIMAEIARSFDLGEGPLTAEKIAVASKMPIRLVEYLLSLLSEAGMVHASDTNDVEGWLPGRPPSSTTVLDVVAALGGGCGLEMDTKDAAQIVMERLVAAASRTRENMTIEELAELARSGEGDARAIPLA